MASIESAQPDSAHFGFESYATKPRWNSYWHQLDETLRERPSHVLIVGGGDGIVPAILRRLGVRVTVADVVADLQPDVVSDIRELPFSDDEFDVSVCCQVLEHLPFESVPTALSELRRVTSKRVIVSLPDCHRSISAALRIGRSRSFKTRVSVPRREKWVFNGVHYWEIGARNYSLARVRSALDPLFVIESEYLVEENDYHRFFQLRPR